MIIPKKYIEAKGNTFEVSPVGTGPYKLLGRQEGDSIKLVAQDSHWRVGVPKYKYITFRIIPDEGTREAALKTGEVDLALVGLTNADKLGASGMTIHKKIGSIEPLLTMIRIYDPNNPLNKKKVRQALVYAIDKAAIVKHVLMGQGEVIGHHFPMTKWAIGYKSYPSTPYDPKRAKQLLTEAGYPNGFTIYLYSYVDVLPEAKLINEAIAGYWKAIGLKPIILEMEYEAFKPVWARKKDPPGPSVNLNGWTSRAVYAWFGLYHTKGTWSHTADPELDKLIESFNSQVSLEGYGKAAQKAMDYAVDNFYHTSLFSTHEFWVSSPKIPNWALGRNPYGASRFEYIGRIK
jgi:peptide/nickel transport system substrate-binding protein